MKGNSSCNGNDNSHFSLGLIMISSDESLTNNVARIQILPLDQNIDRYDLQNTECHYLKIFFA